MPILFVVVGLFILGMCVATYELICAIKSEKKLEEEKAKVPFTANFTIIYDEPTITGNWAHILEGQKIHLRGKKHLLFSSQKGLSFNGRTLDSKSDNEGSIPSGPAIPTSPYSCENCGRHATQKYKFIGETSGEHEFNLCDSCYAENSVYLMRGKKVKEGLERIIL
tara:strand:- start:12760 stop:13257 length:498 start_codon:yes stop_codon:yes gene_type:complete